MILDTEREFLLLKQLILFKVSALIISSRFMIFDADRDKISPLVSLLLKQLISFIVLDLVMSFRLLSLDTEALVFTITLKKLAEVRLKRYVVKLQMITSSLLIIVEEIYNKWQY